MTADQKKLRFILREATRTEHDDLDKSFAALLPPETPETYHEFIRMNHAAHAGVEPWLLDSPLIEWLPEWPSWSRLADLATDMSAMHIAPLDAAAFGYAHRGLPEAIGVAYVLEGSRLGAVFIHRQLLACDILNRWPQASFAYLSNSGTGGHFKTLAGRMEELTLSPEETDRCVEAARAGFNYFRDIRDLAARRAEQVTEHA